MKTSGGAGKREEQAAGNAWDMAEVQCDTEELRTPPIDLVRTVPEAGGLLLWLATVQEGWRNIPN